jgi:hypothetical protein
MLTNEIEIKLFLKPAERPMTRGNPRRIDGQIAREDATEAEASSHGNRTTNVVLASCAVRLQRALPLRRAGRESNVTLPN